MRDALNMFLFGIGKITLYTVYYASQFAVVFDSKEIN